MVAVAILRFHTRRGGVTDNRASRRIDDGKAPPGVIDLGERIVAAGVEHDDAHPALDRFQRTHQVDQPQRIVVEIGRRGDLGIDRQQIVLARHLHAVTGIVDHGDGAGAALGDLGGEVLHDPDHVAARQVGRLGDLEAGRV